MELIKSMETGDELRQQKEKLVSESIVNIGRNGAGNILHQAVERAKTGEQLMVEMKTCKALAVHILATFIFNDEKMAKLPREDGLGMLIDEIKTELEFLDANAAKMTHRKIGGKNAK